MLLFLPRLDQQCMALKNGTIEHVTYASYALRWSASKSWNCYMNDNGDVALKANSGRAGHNYTTGLVTGHWNTV